MATVKLEGVDVPQNASTEQKIVYLTDTIIKHKKTLEYVLGHLESGGTTVINNTTVPPTPVDVTNSPVVQIDLYENGMYTKYNDGTEYDWSFTKDGDGRITLIVNNTTTIETVVNWNEGVK